MINGDNIDALLKHFDPSLSKKLHFRCQFFQMLNSYTFNNLLPVFNIHIYLLKATYKQTLLKLRDSARSAR